jgi:ABC-type transport system involved in Fe-S cluster assembly fused permease/ATPase subunit
LDEFLKSILKRQLPYLIGGTITGIIITYYYGFLFSIIVNSTIWFAISTFVNKYYWHYTGFRDEFYLASKYIAHMKNKDSINNTIAKVEFKKEDVSVSKNSILIDIDKAKINHNGNNSKFKYRCSIYFVKLI